MLVSSRVVLNTSFYVEIRMKKIHLNLYVDENLVEKAKQHGLILSRFFENKLLEYFTFIGAVSKVKADVCGCRDLNPSYKLGKLK